MRTALLVVASLLATCGFAQDNFPDIPKIRLGAVQKEADLFKNRGMDIRLRDIGRPDELVEKFYWARLTLDIASRLPEFFEARAKKHQAALDEWWKLYVCDDPVWNVEAELAFSSGGWEQAIGKLIRETCSGREVTLALDDVSKAKRFARADLRVLQEIARDTHWIYDDPEHHWVYEVVEDAKKSGLARLYPNRLIRGSYAYTRKDCAHIVMNAHENLLGAFTAPRQDRVERYFDGRTGLSRGLLKLLRYVQPEVTRIGGDAEVVRKDFTRLSAWLDRGRWSDKLNRPYLSETPPGHWADTAMTGLYEAGILIGREARPIQSKR